MTGVPDEQREQLLQQGILQARLAGWTVNSRVGWKVYFDKPVGPFKAWLRSGFHGVFFNRPSYEARLYVDEHGTPHFD